MRKALILIFCGLLLAQTTDDFYPTASGDDGHVYGQGASYPPSATGFNITATDFRNRNNWVDPTFTVSLGMVRFDTSGIPDTATVTAATLKLYAITLDDTDNRNFQCEYYTGWPIGTEDYTTSPGNDAHSGTLLDNLTPNAYNSFSLGNLGSISKTDYTGFRCSISGGQPTGLNHALFSAYDGGTNLPWLQVTYTTPGGAPKIIVVTEQ